MRYCAENIGSVTPVLRDRNSVFYCPRSSFTTQKSAAKQFLSHTSFSGQIGERELLAFVREQLVGNTIIPLFSPRRPSAIFRFVVSVVINSLKRVASFAWRLYAHIGEEVHEAAPPFADGYPAFFVVFECRIRWSRAARDHVAPRHVGGRFSTLPCVSMYFHATIPLEKASIA